VSLFEAKSLRFLVGPSQERRQVSFTLEPGEMIRISGHSGSGKTTLLRTLARLNLPEGGDLLLKGKPWQIIPARAWRTHVAYVNQKPVFFSGTVESNLKRPFELKERKSDQSDIDQAREFLTRLLLPQNILEQDALTLSVGESSRAALVRTLLVNPLVLLLDEPTAALDSTAKEAVALLLKDWIAAGTRAIVIVSHDPDTIEPLCCKDIALEMDA
jgi:putative ABC transport system ATP-binding protein